MKRAEGIDTYYGEGLLYPKVKEWDFCYIKVAHGKNSFFHPIDKKTEKIIEASAEIPIRGTYHYMLANNQKNHWKKQAGKYLDAVYYIEQIMGTEVDFDVLDIEGRYNKVLQGLNWVYPAKFGAMVYEMARFVQKERRKPLFLYMNKSTYHECFIWHGYTFVKDYPLIIANYPFRKWNEELRTVPIDDERWNPALPAGRTNWHIWQYHDGYPSDGVTDSKAIDVNVWNGTKEDMMKFFGKDQPQIPPTDPVGEADIRRDERNKVIDASKERIEGLRQ